ncbi:MAG TPA: hypothetical protein VMT87_11975 [Vicinamibacteria bacterium]|nr:hypothetical protein [Vicinamibacteria bacterium]
MRPAAWLGRAVLPVAAAAAALFAAKAVVPDGGLYRTLLTPHALQVVGALGKLAFLLLAAVFAWRNARAFEPGNPVRPAWQMLAAGSVAFFLAQLSYAPYQLVWNQDPPFPSLADVLFMLAYPLFVAALFAFIRGYQEAGYPVGTARARWALAGAVAAGCAVVGYFVLRPVVLGPSSGLEKLLNVSYPLLDFVLLIPTALLMRMTLAMRGGAAWKIWAALLAGFLFLSVGDILFAYLPTLGRQDVDPLIHAMYILSYALTAYGVLHQHELLKS